jgi:hypothetical protein
MSASVLRSPVETRIIASSVVNAIATHGVRRSGRTFENAAGTMPCADIPYSRREAMIMPAPPRP